MTTYDGQSPITGTGIATAAAIDAWFAVEGQKEGRYRYAPDKRYKPAPAIGQSIVGYAGIMRINSDLAAAQCLKESAAWQSAIARDKRNPAGLGAENSDATGTAYDKAITFLTPDMGIRAQIAHLADYAIGKGDWTQYDPRASNMPAAWFGIAKTLNGLDGRWADPGVGYGADVAALANQLVAFAQTGGSVPTPRPPHIALSAGHRNSSGGDAHETAQTAILTPAIAAACRALGMDVRVVQGHDGADMFPGNLHSVAQTVAGWDAGGWPVDIYLEVHTEGAGGARGMFAIFPDWGDDVDTDVRDKLGPDIVARVTAATGLGKRGSGLMSEKQTGVGAGGDRLGIFAYTASIKDHATRLIVEFGAHDNAADLAIVDTPDFAGKAGAAVAQAFAAFLGWQSDTSDSGGTNPLPDVTPSTNDAVTFAEVPYKIVLGFKGFWEAINPALRLLLLGFPAGNERAVKTIPGIASAQPFERGWLIYQPHENPQITMALREFQHELEQEFLADEAA